jgi:dCMP deaminase
MPTGWDNNCEDVVDGLLPTLKTKPEVLHAESNALMKVARSTNSSNGATLFVTHAPCIECAKLIHQAGIKTVYYKSNYRDFIGINFLEKCGITVEHTGEDNVG